MEPYETNLVIYEIICVSGNPHIVKGPGMFRTCNWGYYFNRKDAEKVIEENQTDISELGYYKYALLCEKEEGPCAIAVGLQWYEFFWDFGIRDAGGKMPYPKFIEAKKIDPPEMYFKDREYHSFIMKEDL